MFYCRNSEKGARKIEIIIFLSEIDVLLLQTLVWGAKTLNHRKHH